MTTPNTVRPASSAEAQWEEELSTHRGALFGYAYRLLLSASEAEDVLQDAWLRVCERAFDDVNNPRAFLFTTVSRLCLDRLKRSSRTREQYVGPWLPEPVLTDDAALLRYQGATAGERLADEGMAAAESISLAFLVLLETLSPTERAAFVLHRVFDFPFGHIANTLQKSEPAVRKAASRAAKKLAEGRPRFAPSQQEHARLFAAFGGAVTSGDVDTLEELLAEDVQATSDGGGKVSSSTQVVEGKERVRKFLIGVARLATGEQTRLEWATVNGWPAMLVFEDAALESVVTIECDGQTISAIRIVRNPDKLAWLAREVAHVLG